MQQNPKKIVVAQWVRMKCTFGCGNYGEGACCPPNAPTVDECQHFLEEYGEAVLFHVEKRLGNPNKGYDWSKGINKRLMDMEREVFLAGNEKAFLLVMSPCKICKKCAKSRGECKNKERARPTPEAFAIDVFSTARQAGYPIEVLSDYTHKMNRYAILLIR
ncbi:MAG: DUF2284 domain-containing protein [Euryarchaeota archaeon]|nr:DUF2284 domain-containing protein [Euryarchaeota archaeon]